MLKSLEQIGHLNLYSLSSHISFQTNLLLDILKQIILFLFLSFIPKNHATYLEYMKNHTSHVEVKNNI